MESLDDLLAELKAEYQEKELGKPPKKQPLFAEEEFQLPPPLPVTYQPQSAAQNWRSSVDDHLLAEIKTEFEEKERTEELKRQQILREEQQRKEQEIREEQLRSQQREQRRREALAQEATQWLKNLNPRSEEGSWFEEFSYSYPSKLEAAIDYLQALRETHR